MLKQRVITAVILLAIILPCLLAPSQWPFVILASVALSLAAWEWARLTGLPKIGTWLTAAAFAAFTAIAASLQWQHYPFPDSFWLSVTLLWFFTAIFTLRGGVAGWGQIPQKLRFIGGLWVLGTTWLAVLAAYAKGINFLFSVLALVWVADIGAYFAGRAFGQKLFSRKLAPTISPGKSWEGVLGGMIAVLLLAAIWIGVDRHYASESANALHTPSLYSILYAHGLVTLIFGCTALAALSVMGDLQESLVKRSAGMKDSSQILPGHGGMLDRIDALLPTVAAAIMLVAFVTPASSFL